MPEARASRTSFDQERAPGNARRGARRETKAAARLIIQRGDHHQAVHFSPRLMLLAGAAFLLFTALYFGATAYLVFRDDLARTDRGDEAALREAYEDRISSLRNEIERIRSRRAVDHATVEQKVDELLDRQDELGQRQELLEKLTEAARRAGLDVAPVPVPQAKPGEKKAGDKQASADDVARPRVTLASVAGGDSLAALPGADRIASIETDIATMETAQDRAVEELQAGITTRADRIAQLLKRLGRKIPRPVAEEDVGGPFVPIPAASDPSDRFANGVSALAEDLDRLAGLRSLALALPLDVPLQGAPISSGFGPRLDPFLGRPAMHTGIDFMAPRDYPAHAVAAGRVIAAEWNGGYGNMVDVDHGNGVVTRYGHLAAITVHVGDRVVAGGRIGRVGSTGRSTGPHLHYEIRIDGEPIDPTRYIAVGRELTALL